MAIQFGFYGVPVQVLLLDKEVEVGVTELTEPFKIAYPTACLVSMGRIVLCGTRLCGWIRDRQMQIVLFYAVHR